MKKNCKNVCITKEEETEATVHTGSPKFDNRRLKKKIKPQNMEHIDVSLP